MASDWLIERMKNWKDDLCLVGQNLEFTYSAVLKAFDYWSQILEDQQVTAGRVVALEGDYSLDVCALLLALIKKKAIIVPLTKTSSKHREEFIETAQVQYIFNFFDADAWKVKRVDTAVTNPTLRKFIDLSEPGLVLFSSGSTGKNKAALHNFTKLVSKFKTRRRRLRATNFLLFDHIGGINTLFYTLSNGGVVVTPQERSPEKICRLIQKYQVELLPTTPTFLNLLMISGAYKEYDLSSLKLITYGTEVMVESLLKRVHKIFPNAKLLQTYGLSELGILQSKSKDSKSTLVSVGGEGYQTKIVDGTLWIKADSAMIGYLNAPSPFDREGWMDTEDIVECDGDYLRILGRKTEIINVGGEKVYPSEVETVLMQIENVKDATVWGQKNPIMGNIVAANILLENAEALSTLKKRVRKFCKGRLEDYKIPVKIAISDEMQYTGRFKKVRN